MSDNVGRLQMVKRCNVMKLLYLLATFSHSILSGLCSRGIPVTLSDSGWTVGKKINAAELETALFYYFIYASSLAPILPTMQRDHRRFAQRFRCAILLVANVAAIVSEKRLTFSPNCPSWQENK